MHPAKGASDGFRLVWILCFSVFLCASARTASPLPEGPGPSTNRFALPPGVDLDRLTWVGGGTNLLVNGDFETGDFTGWTREGPVGKEFRVLNRSTSSRVFSGNHAVAFQSLAQGPMTLSQVVTLPADAKGAVLSWVDQIQNDAPRYAPPDQTFRVEVQTLDGFPLATLHQRITGDVLRTPWSRRSASLGAFAGQTVRIAFIESDNIGPLNVFLDDVRLETAAPPATVYDVLFGTNFTLTAANRLGSTAAPSLPLPELRPGTLYRWRVDVTDADGTREGPLWAFTTGTNRLASSLRWTLPDGPVQAFQPVAAQLTALGVSGLAATGFTNSVQLATVSPGSRPSTLVISEVLLNTGVEFLNGTTGDLDIAGWDVSLYDSSTWPRPRTTFVFPPGSVVAAGKNIVLRQGGTAPGGGTSFFTGQPINWTFNNANRVIAVLLRNAAGTIVDFFAADRAFPASITEPTPVPLAEWIGTPAPRASSSFEAYQRLGSRDRQLAGDWLICGDSFGRLNPYGGPQFLPGTAVHPLVPDTTGPLDAGQWTGTIEPTRAGTGQLFLADDRQGRIGWSTPVDILQAPIIALELPALLNEGASATAILRLPSAFPTNVVIQLESSWPTRLPVPAALTVPAGTLQISFPIAVADDTRLQGLQAVMVRVRAPGFAVTEGTLTVEDDETALLTLVAPAQVREGQPDDMMIVQVNTAPEARVYVELTQAPSGQLSLPAGVWIPAGQTQATVPVRAINDAFIDGDVSVQVTARSGNWSEGSAVIVATDNEDRQLRLTVPGRIRGGEPVQARVQLSGVLPSDLEIEIAFVDPGILSAPASVRIPAGATTVIFELQAAPGQPFRGTSLVAVSASAPGFQSASARCEVWDETIRKLDLQVTDLVLHPGWDRLLAAVSSQDSTHPNQLVVVNPYTGAIERSLPVAADPTALALTDDGKVLWVASYSEGRVQRVDLETFSVSSSFSLDEHTPIQLVARRGRNDSVVVYRAKMNAGNDIGLYVDGVRQPNAVVPGHLMWMGLTQGAGDRVFVIIPSVISGVLPQLHELTVTDQGLELLRSGPEVPTTTWTFADGQLYSPLGHVQDATTLQPLPGIAGVGHALLTVEPARDQAFYLTYTQDGLTQLTRASLSLRTALETISIPNPRTDLSITRPVRWGSQGLAFRADTTLYLIDSALMNPGTATDLQLSSAVPETLTVGQEVDWTLTVTNAGPVAATVVKLDGPLPLGWTFVRADVPGGSGTGNWAGWTATLPPLSAGESTTVRIRLRPNLAGTQPLSARAALLQYDAAPANNTVALNPVIRLDVGPDSRQAIDLSALDLSYDPQRDALWATVAANATQGSPARLVRINPQTGLVTGEFPTGPLPGRLARSDDGKSLYVAVDGEAVIRRFDLQTETWGQTLALFDHPTNTPQAYHQVRDIVVIPGTPERVAATWSVRYFPESENAIYYRTVVFRDGVRLPDEVGEGPSLELAPGGEELITFTGFIDYRLAHHQLTPTGLKTLGQTNGVLGGSEIRVVGQRLYSNSGRAVDWPGLDNLAIYNISVEGPVLPLPDQNRMVLFDNGGFQTSALVSMKVFDLGSGRLLDEIPFGAEFPAAGPAVHCGVDRIAFRAQENASPPNRIVILRTSALPSAPAPADIQTHLTLVTPVMSFQGAAEFRLSVTNAGPGVAPRVHYRLAWLGNAVALEASRGTVSHDYYTGIRGQVDELAPGESVEVRFRFVAGDAGRFAATASAYSAAQDPVPANDTVTRYQSVAWMPALGQTTSLNLVQAALAADAAGRRLFASAADGVVEIDPALGRISSESRFGPGPGALAVSADSQSLWVAFDTQRRLRRFRLTDGAVLQDVPSIPGNLPIRHLAAHPSDPQIAVFAVGSQVFAIGPSEVALVHSYADTQAINAIAFAPDGSVLIARAVTENLQQRNLLERIDLSGAILQTSPRDVATTSLHVAGSRVYLDGGRVNDSLSLDVQPDLGVPGFPTPLPTASRVGYLENRSGAWRLHLTDPAGVVPSTLMPLGGFIGTVDPSSGAAWGADGIAFRSDLVIVLGRLGELPVPPDRDTDGDGLSDVWEWHNNLNPNLAADALADPDGDGVSTYDEFVAGTDHARADSVLRLREAALNNGQLTMRFEGQLGRKYQLEGAGQIGAAWEPVGTPVLGNNALIDLTIPLPDGVDTVVYRLRVTPD